MFFRESSVDMKTTAIVKIPGTKGFEIEDIELKPIQPDEALVRIKNASICGTDVHIWQNDDWAKDRIVKKIIVGHEGSGEVLEIGKEVKDIKIGDRVAFESHIFCDRCERCKNGLRHLCTNLKIIGADTNGLFSQYEVLPARNLWKLGADVSLENAAIFEPLGNAIYCITKAEVKNKRVLILGCGPAGLFVTILSNKLEAKTITCIEKSLVRVELARKCGANHIITSLDNLTKDSGEFDIVFEMSGNIKLIEVGLKLISPTGTFIAFGITPENKISLDYINNVIYKCINIQGIHGRLIWGSWYQLNGIYPLIKNNLNLLFTHRFHFLEINKGIETILNNQAGKVLLTF